MNNNISIENFARENAVMIDKENRNRNRVKMYKCKECNKEYDSYQALGGHRASHKSFKRKKNADGQKEVVLHVCRVCRKGFESGHSLGGHMRKHYSKPMVYSNSNSNNNDNNDDARSVVTVATYYVASTSSSNSVPVALLVESKDLSEAVFEYDLNFTPVENEKVKGEESM